MKWSFSKKCYVLKIVTRKVCKLIQEKEFVKCFNLKGNTLVDIHNESGGKHSSLLKKAVTLFSIDKMYQKKKPFPLMMWGKKTNCMWEHLIIHTSFGNVYAFDLSILTSIVLAADSVLYWTHPFVKIKAILYSHFQFSSLLKKKTAMWFELWIYWRQLWWINSQGICKKWFGKFLLGYGGMGRTWGHLSTLFLAFPLAPFTL